MTVVEMNTDIHAQRTASVGGKTSVRILATVDALNFTNVGFKITMTYNGVTKNIDATADSDGTGITVTKEVWNSVQANGDTVSADVLGGKYIYGVVINNVPDTGVVFNVTSYKTALNGASVEGASTVTLDVANIPAPTAN